MIAIAPSDVALALRSSKPPASSSSGTITTPPPTPKSALKKPATSPIRSSRTAPMLRRGRDDGRAHRAARRRARAGGALPRLRRRPRADRRPLPQDATPSTETRAELERLVARYALVAIVSGRAGDDVRERVGSKGSSASARTASSSSRRPNAGGRRSPPSPPTRPGRPAHVELKGLTISFHYRGRADEREAVRELEAIADDRARGGLVARFGRKVLEVLPPVGSNKGTAARHLLEEQRLGGRSPPATTRPTSTRSGRSTASTWRYASRSPRPSRRSCCSRWRTSSSTAPLRSSNCCGACEQGEVPAKEAGLHHEIGTLSYLCPTPGRVPRAEAAPRLREPHDLCMRTAVP